MRWRAGGGAAARAGRADGGGRATRPPPGGAPDPAGGAYDAPPDPLIVSGFTPKALAPRPLRRLKADPPSFFWTNLTLFIRHQYRIAPIAEVAYSAYWLL